MDYNPAYVIRVWLTSSIVGTTLFFLVALLNRSHTAVFNLAEAVPFHLFVLVIATIVSVPAVVLLWLVIHLLSQTSISMISSKLIIAVACIILCLLTFSFFGVGYNKREWIIMSCYCVPLLVGVFLYKLR